MSNSVRSHRRQPTRLRRPWDSPGKSTGVGCHCLLRNTYCYIQKITSNILLYSIENFYFVLCNDLYLALCDAMDPSGSSVHGTFQARILVRVAMTFSRGSSWPRDSTRVSCIAGRFFTVRAAREGTRKDTQCLLFPFDSLLLLMNLGKREEADSKEV